MTGSGPYGEVRARDVENFVPSAAPVRTSPAFMPAAGVLTDAFSDLQTSSMRQVRLVHTLKASLVTEVISTCVCMPHVYTCISKSPV